MKHRFLKLTVAVTTLTLAACGGAPNETAIKNEITEMLHIQDTAWNEGNIDGFMAHYLNSEELRFASGGKVNRGWQATNDGYKKRYPDKGAMGTLSFKNLEITVLSDEHAQVFGRWELARVHDNPGGLFTLLLEKKDGKWLIVSDHTSSDASTDPVSTDPLTINAAHPPKTVELDFNSHGSALNGHLYLAGGDGIKPTVIMLHGFPGYEKNLDMAQAIRRAGFNVLFFHYRGAWGSEGNFSLTHVIEDARAASEFVRSEEAGAAYNIDPNHITFIGHSMGGFAALAAGAQDKNVQCVGALSPADYGIRGAGFTGEGASEARAGFAAYVNGAHLFGKGPLKGVTGAALLDEISDNEQAFSVSQKAGEFDGRSVLLTAAKDDTVLPPNVYHDALVDAFQKEAYVNLAYQTFEGDHSYNWTRLALTSAVIDWLNGNCR